MNQKISIITPCFNSERYIKETVLSVINQSAVLSGRIELEYIICDGQSCDNTLSIIQSLSHPAIKLISEPDTGMYDALSKGLKHASGDIIAYINAGDYYSLCAFDVIVNVFENKKAQWLTGYNFFYNDRNQVVEVTLPFKYRKRLFDCGMYGKLLPNVQQESTFWSAELNNSVDCKALSNFKYAGDYYLWLQFAQKAELKIVKSYLGGFKFHSGQLSSQYADRYLDEVANMVREPDAYEVALAKIDRLLWAAPFKIKYHFNSDGFLVFNEEKDGWA
ncbi:MAG: glycosyltransferase [Cyanobacteria bacterium P01_D01_bin.105]